MSESDPGSFQGWPGFLIHTIPDIGLPLRDFKAGQKSYGLLDSNLRGSGPVWVLPLMSEFYHPSCLLQMLITCTAEHISGSFYIPFDSPWNALSFGIWFASFRANPRKSTFSRGTVTFLDDVTGQIWLHFWHLRHRIAIEKLFGRHKNLIAKFWSQCQDVRMSRDHEYCLGRGD